MGDKSFLDRNWLLEYPQLLLLSLKELGARWPEIYVTGGAVRDWLRGIKAADLDITVAGDALAAARAFASRTGGAFVLLDEGEGVARVVFSGQTVDFSGFREGTASILADLLKRDFSINAMAVAIDPESGGLAEPFEIIDPVGGHKDLVKGRIRATSEEVFRCDPLRLLRAYRISAVHSFIIEEESSRWISEKCRLICRSSPERLSYELDLIMKSPRAARAFGEMAEVGLLAEVFPELLLGEGLQQPSSHHLDVFQHNLTALQFAEKVVSNPEAFFPDHGRNFREYLELPARKMLVKWAALFHDLGKPETCKLTDSGRATFYNHDRAGAATFRQIGLRMRWSREHIGIVGRLIELHMYPFHLQNAMQKTGISPRACLRLVKAAENELAGLFLLAMADSLAASGPLKPPGMEENLVRLYDLVERVYRESIMPVLQSPPLLTGNDLKEMGLIPGPEFRRILEGVQQAQVAGELDDRKTAIAWVKSFLADPER